MCCSVFDLTFHGQWHLNSSLGLYSNVLEAFRVCLSCLRTVPKLFFQDVPVLWPIWAQTSLPRAVPKEIQLWDSYQLPWRDLVPNRFVYRKIWLFSLVVWNFIASGQWHLFPCQPLCSYCFACLESYRKSIEYRTGATIEGVIARCTGCSSKPWRQFGTFWIGSLHQAACSRLNLCKGGNLRSWWPPRFKSKETMEIGLNRLSELTPPA